MKIGEKSKDGGLFAGIIVYPFGERYELYVSEEETELKYSEDLVDHGTNYEWDGAENTEKLLGKSPAADWCRSFGPEWYLPAKNELASLLPYGLLRGWYWSSTQYAVYTNDAWCQYFTNGCQDGSSKHNNYYVRAVRRVKLQEGIMVDQLYVKRGNRYQPIGREFTGFPADGIWLVADGRQSCLIRLCARRLPRGAEKLRGDAVTADTIVCKKNFVMKNGPAAFLAGKAYQWRWTTEKEQDDTGCHVVVDGELGPDHFLTIADVLEHFEA